MTIYVRSDFNYELPERLIAQYPLPQRAASRLLQVDIGSGVLEDAQFHNLPQYLRAGDLLVLNNTRVIPARLYARKASGGAVEIMLERMLSPRRALVQLKSSKPPRPGARLYLQSQPLPKCNSNQASATPEANPADTLLVVERRQSMFVLEFADEIMPTLQRFGHQPLPPYINRAAHAVDDERYQTVFAKHPGAVAAPTASLHFDSSMLERLTSMGVGLGYVTLHVAAGTFQPLREEDLAAAQLHAEYMQVDDTLCAQIRATKACGGRVVAVGTTVVRCLEQAVLAASSKQHADCTDIQAPKWQPEMIQPYAGDTRLFIRPGYRFSCVDAMLTNFHLPASSLLMLVAAFAGYELTMQAYRHAVMQNYRFFSYGDAMWLASS